MRNLIILLAVVVPSLAQAKGWRGVTPGNTPLADVVLVVAERETTTIEEMRRLSAVLRHLGAPVVGIALTDGGLEIFDWGLAETELRAGESRPDDERDPTERIPIPGSTDVAPAPPFDELSVVEHAPREV